MADVFISYSRKDSSKAKKLILALESNGISYWFDKKDIPHGARYDEIIPSAIPQCSIFLLLVSQGSMQRPSVMKELRIADKHGMLIIPFMLENVDLIGAVSYHIESNNRIDAFEDWDIAVEELVEDVKEFSQEYADFTVGEADTGLTEPEWNTAYGEVNAPVTQYTGKTLEEMASTARGDVVDDYSLFQIIQQAQGGDCRAQRFIAKAYLSRKGMGRNTNNPKKAIYWLEKAIDQGDAEAMYLLGNCYYSGNGLKRNYAYAAYWYEQSATQIEPYEYAIYAMANCYSAEKGVPDDLLKKAEWCRRAMVCEEKYPASYVWYTKRYIDLFYTKSDEKKLLIRNGYSLSNASWKIAKCIKIKRQRILAKTLILFGLATQIVLMIILGYKPELWLNYNLWSFLIMEGLVALGCASLYTSYLDKSMVLKWLGMFALSFCSFLFLRYTLVWFLLKIFAIDGLFSGSIAVSVVAILNLLMILFLKKYIET